MTRIADRRRPRDRVRGIAACTWLGVCCIALAVALGGCASVLGVDSISVGQLLGVQVRGLWNGADGVRLRLEADGIAEEITVGNGEHAFTGVLARSAQYVVTVAESPSLHRCQIEGPGDGTVTDDTVAPISIACTGPAVTIDVSLPGWTFDPSAAEQSLDASVFDESVAITVGGTLQTASIDDTAVAIGIPSSAVPLPLGPRAISVAVANGALTRSYRLTFVRGGAALGQRTYGKASNTAANSAFGTAIAIDRDTLVVGAPSAPATSSSNSDRTGAAFVFVRVGATWVQQAMLKPGNAVADDHVGCAVAIDGDTIVFGADGTDSVDGEGSLITDAGAVYVFVRSGTTWTQQAVFFGDSFQGGLGRAIAVSGNTLVAGAPDYAGGTGIASVFVRSATTWTPNATLGGTNTVVGRFGAAVAVEGTTIAVTAKDEPSTAAVRGAGVAYVFARSGTTWPRQARLLASNPEANDHFGTSIALSGGLLAVGAVGEDSAIPGGDGGQADNAALDAGAVYVFAFDGTAWPQQAYLKSSNPGAGDLFGSSVALNGDTLAVGAPGEQSAAIGTGGDQSDNTAAAAGAAYLFVRSGATWAQASYVKASNTNANDQLGSAVAVSGDFLIAGALGESSASTGVDGDQASNAATAAGAFYIYH